MIQPVLSAGISDSAPTVKGADNPAKVKDAARQFEALLVGQMLKSMRDSEGGWLGTGDDEASSSAMEYAQEMFAQSLSASGGLGLANLVAKGLDTPAQAVTWLARRIPSFRSPQALQSCAQDRRFLKCTRLRREVAGRSDRFRFHLLPGRVPRLRHRRQQTGDFPQRLVLLPQVGFRQAAPHVLVEARQIAAQLSAVLTIQRGFELRDALKRAR